MILALIFEDRRRLREAVLVLVGWEILAALTIPVLAAKGYLYSTAMLASYAVAAAPNGIMPAAGAPSAYWPDTHLYQRNTIIQLRITDTSGFLNTISACLAGISSRVRR